eukprot:16437704-Heterocapsa_arctica.AAC.1
MGKLMNHMSGKTGNIMDKIKSDGITQCSVLHLQSMEAYSDHNNISELYHHQVRPSKKLGKTRGGKAHNLLFMVMICYTGNIINDCDSNTERCGKKGSYEH